MTQTAERGRGSGGGSARILSGPHIKRMINQAGSAPLVEIEALAFHGLTRQRTTEPWRISTREIR